jgi:hypothetical protein
MPDSPVVLSNNGRSPARTLTAVVERLPRYDLTRPGWRQFGSGVLYVGWRHTGRPMVEDR